LGTHSLGLGIPTLPGKPRERGAHPPDLSLSREVPVLECRDWVHPGLFTQSTNYEPKIRNKDIMLTVQMLGGERKHVPLPSDKTFKSLISSIAHEFNTSMGLKLICGGAVVGDDDAHGKKKLTEIGPEEIVLAMQVSVRAPPPSWGAIKKEIAATEGEDEKEDEEVQQSLNELLSSSWGWEKSLVAWLRRIGMSRGLISTLIFLRPVRLVWLLLFLFILLALNQFSPLLGPPFILVSILCCIFLNLSNNKKPGDMSAYSICNEGVQRLPGQLDADAVDEQIRRGQI
jgi:hypothetical protein